MDMQVLSLRPDSSGKGMERVYGRFQVEVTMETKNLPIKKKKRICKF